MQGKHQETTPTTSRGSSFSDNRLHPSKILRRWWLRTLPSLGKCTHFGEEMFIYIFHHFSKTFTKLDPHKNHREIRTFWGWFSDSDIDIEHCFNQPPKHHPKVSHCRGCRRARVGKSRRTRRWGLMFVCFFSQRAVGAVATEVFLDACCLSTSVIS